MGTCDDVGGHEFSDAVGSLGTGFNRSFYAADVALDENGEKAAADGDLLDKSNGGRFGHGVTRFDRTGEALRFDQSNGFDVSLNTLCPVLNLGLPLLFGSGILNTPDTEPFADVTRLPPSEPPVGVTYTLTFCLSKKG